MSSNTGNLTLGAGKLWFAKFDTDGITPLGERFIGNCSSVTVNSQGNRLDHYDSTSGKKTLDYTTMLQVNRTGSVVTDDLRADNIALYALGFVQNNTITSTTMVADTLHKVSKGLTYQIGKTVANPEGARKVSTVVLKQATVTLVLGTDYTIDTDLARITLLSTGSTITEGSDLTLTYTQVATTVTRIVAGDVEAEGTLRFIADNAEGNNIDYFFPHVRLAPNGDLNLVSQDQWNTLPFNLTVLQNLGVDPWIATTRAT